MSHEELVREALTLPLADRVQLAQVLWESIGDVSQATTDDEEREAVELAWKRDAELDSGAVAGRTHEQVMEAARRALKCS